MTDLEKKKNKSVAFISNTKDEEDQCDLDTDEGMTNDIVLLGIKFNKVVKIMDRKLIPNFNNILSNIKNNNDFQKRTRTEERSNQGKGIQCHVCEGLDTL